LRKKIEDILKNHVFLPSEINIYHSVITQQNHVPFYGKKVKIKKKANRLEGMFRLIKFLFIGIIVLAIVTFLFMQQDSFGKLPSAERLTRIEKSDNYKDGKFKNRITTNTIAEGVSYVSMMIDFFSKGTDREPLKDLPSVKTDLKATQHDKPFIVWFGHSSFLIKINGKNILADPIFSDRPSPVQYVGSKSYPGTRVYNADQIPDLDAIIISHDHYDHLDYNTILKLKDRTKLFCVPLGVGEHLKKWGVDEKSIVEFDWWQSEQILPGFELTATPARHFSGRGFSRDKTLWASYVLKSDKYKIFIGGDSGYDNAFKEIGEKFGPFDIAMLECGQYDLKWPNIHMMPEETVQASIDLNAKVLLPVHWGKFTLGLHPWKEPIERALKYARPRNVKVTTPKIGEPIVFDSPLPVQEWWKPF
jgi:L-ascorbate metabolism protein UlaG (beta-lactamase superfamily)